MSCKPYTNNFKGRSNRRERAKHLRDEFDAIEEGFKVLQDNTLSTHTVIHTITTTEENTIIIDPENGQLQEVTITQSPTTIIVAGPQSDEARRVSLLVHGSNKTIIIGWGSQAWKERGGEDWSQTYTGRGEYASMLIEFTWDGKAWIGIMQSKNAVTGEVFPFIKDLVSISGDETLTFARAGSATIFDTNEKLWLLPPQTPRFSGSRYVKNLCAMPMDLQGLAWEGDDVSVTTEAGAGPSGGDTDNVQFTTTGGELYCWFIPPASRAAAGSDPIKIAVRFRAKMATTASGSIRAVMAYMGVTEGLSTPCHEAITLTLTGNWREFSHTFYVYQVGQDYYRLDINDKRLLTKFGFKSPSGSPGGNVLIEGVQIEPLRGGYEEISSELQEGTIGSSLTLAATAGSTGDWNDGTKVMALDIGEFVDFQDSLEVGKTYLMVCAVTSGASADLLLDDDRTHWKAYGSNPDVHFVKDAPFTFTYEGGVVKWKLNSGSTGTYTVNIYECTGNQAVYDTELGNSVSSTNVLTEATGVPVGSVFAEGLAIESAGGLNLLDADEYRSFYNWTKTGLTNLDDTGGRVSSYRGEYGIDFFPGKATLMRDTLTSSIGKFSITKTIAADTNEYTFIVFFRRTYDIAGNQRVYTERGVPDAPSHFANMTLTLQGGAGNSESMSVRLDIQRATLNYDGVETITPTEAKIQFINYVEWFRLGFSVLNNGTYTEAVLEIEPCPHATSGYITDRDPTATGWIIADWAQLEIEGGTFRGSSPMVGGYARGVESLTTTLDDGDLYDANSVVVGDVTSTAFQFDYEDYIWKNTLWTDTPLEFGVSNLHEFGSTEVLVCDATVDDESGVAISDEAGRNICEESTAPFHPITDTPGLVMWLDGSDPGDSPATQWQDKSGNDYHWSVHSSMPSFVDGAAYFPGNSMRALTDNGTLNSIQSTLQESEVFLVVQAFDLEPEQAVNQRNSVFQLGDGSKEMFWPFTEGVDKSDVSDGRVEVGWASSLRDFNDPDYTRLGAAIYNYMTINMDYSVSNGNRLRCRYDGVEHFSYAPGVFGFANPCYLGRSSNSWAWFKGNIRQVVVYSGILTTAQRALVRAYLETL